VPELRLFEVAQMPSKGTRAIRLSPGDTFCPISPVFLPMIPVAGAVMMV
jgi:hypothetical protein